MLIVTTRFSRTRAAILGLGLLAVAAAALLLSAQPAASPRCEPAVLSTNEDRVAYLASLGWEVQSEPLETLQFLLGQQLEEPFLSYNVLQQAQGFDLRNFLGQSLTRYTYAVTNYPGRPQHVQANLYLCGGIVAAGDLCCPEADGFQIALLPEQKNAS